MYLQVVLMNFLLKQIHAIFINSLIFDYFVYKQISSVIGHSCNSVEDDLSLIKLFSHEKITAAVSTVDSDSNIYKSMRHTNHRLGIFFDTRCYPSEYITTAFLNASDHRFYDELHVWLIIGYNLSRILEAINDQAFGISTDFVIAIDNGLQNYELYDLYNKFKDRNSTLNMTFYGEWNQHAGLNISLVELKSARRANLHGLVLRAGFLQSAYRPHQTPLTEYYANSKNGIKDGRAKYGYIILKHLGDIYNFSLECSETEKWAKNDSIGPAVRSLVAGQADIPGIPVNMNHKRLSLVKYVHLGLPLRTCFIFRNPQPTTIKVNEIFRPFALSTWYLTCFVIGLGIIFLYLSLQNENCGTKMNRILNSFTVTIGAVCQQSTDVQMKQYSTRITFISMMIFSLIIYNYYSASVVSARLDEPIYKINDSLVEFAKLGMAMATERMPYLEFFLKAPFWETKVFNDEYWSKYPESKKYMEPEMGLKLVRKGGFAYHVHPDIGYTFIDRTYDNREICELMEVHLGKPSMAMFAVTYNCTFTELFRIGLTKISETGLRRRQVLKWFYRKPRCRKDILSASSINIYEFAPHLLLLALGMLLTINMYLVEVWSYEFAIEILPASYVDSRKRRLIMHRTLAQNFL